MNIPSLLTSVPTSPYGGQAPPASGYRVPLNTQQKFPGPEKAGDAPLVDGDGKSPVYFDSAIMESAVHPCKIGPYLNPPCRVPYGGAEVEHHGRFDLLPYDPETMVLIPASNGRLPPGKRPIIGGYEENGKQLYHAVATIDNTKVPGKTGEHLEGCNFAWGGREHVTTTYAILCWKY